MAELFRQTAVVFHFKSMNVRRIIGVILVLFFLLACENNKKKETVLGKVDTYEKVKDKLKKSENPKIKPSANINELEREINNGGFNQYFFNSSGQNCYETMRALKRTGKIRTAKILEKAINLINPLNLPEKEIIEHLRKRNVSELDDDKINEKLDSLDELFYEYPDGALR